MVNVLSIADFYTQEAAYLNRVDPTWTEEEFQATVATEVTALGCVLGEGLGRAVLDCTCGEGPQAIALAQLGWQVTGSDLTPASIASARRHAEQAGLSIPFEVLDVRDLAGRFPPIFDQVFTCMALDNVGDEAGIAAAVRAMFAVLKPGGMCYIRVRDTEFVQEDQQRYEFKHERRVPFGRVITIEDWEYPSEKELIHIYVYLREDSRHPEYWDTDVFAYRRAVLRIAALERYLQEVGFTGIQFLPRPNRWHPHQVISLKP